MKQIRTSKKGILHPPKANRQNTMAVILALTLLSGILSIPGGTVSHAASKLKVTAPKTVAVNQTVRIRTNMKAKFKSGNKKVATVTQKGVVKGKKAGKAKITVTSKSNKNQKKTITITVKNKLVITAPANGRATLTVDDTVRIKTNLSSTFSSSDTRIAQVSSDGTVTAKSEGTATITVTAKKYKNLVKTVTVTVQKKAEDVTEQPASEDPSSEQPTSEKDTIQNPTTEKQTSADPSTEKATATDPATETPTTERPTTENPITENPTTETPATENPTTENPTTEIPATENPTTENPTTENPITENPTTETPATENPTTENPATETPTTEKPTTEIPTTETPVTEEPTPYETENGVLKAQAKGVTPNNEKLREYGFIVYIETEDGESRLLGYDEYTVEYLENIEEDGHTYQQYEVKYKELKQTVKVETINLPEKLFYAVNLYGDYEGEPLKKGVKPDFNDISNLRIYYGNIRYGDCFITSEEYYENTLNKGVSFGDNTYDDLQINYSNLYWGKINDHETFAEYYLIYDYYFEYEGNVFCTQSSDQYIIDYLD